MQSAKFLGNLHEGLTATEEEVVTSLLTAEAIQVCSFRSGGLFKAYNQIESSICCLVYKQEDNNV